MSTDHSTANGAYAPGGALAGPARAWTKDGIMACPTSRLVRNLRAHCTTLGLACTSSMRRNDFIATLLDYAKTAPQFIKGEKVFCKSKQHKRTIEVVIDSVNADADGQDHTYGVSWIATHLPTAKALGQVPEGDLLPVFGLALPALRRRQPDRRSLRFAGVFAEPVLHIRRLAAGRGRAPVVDAT